MAEDEIVDYFDAQDEYLGTAPRREIKEKKLGAMRVASVLLLSGENEVILGKMALRKGGGRANCYTFTASGHVGTGEACNTAAVRELQEEQDVHMNPGDLIMRAKVVSYESDGQTPKRIRYIYTGVYKGPLRPNPQEYQENKFFTLENLDKFLTMYPKAFYEQFIIGIQQSEMQAFFKTRLVPEEKTSFLKHNTGKEL